LCQKKIEISGNSRSEISLIGTKFGGEENIIK
jgi:hypothetical protein